MVTSPSTSVLSPSSSCPPRLDRERAALIIQGWLRARPARCRFLAMRDGLRRLRVATEQLALACNCCGLGVPPVYQSTTRPTRSPGTHLVLYRAIGGNLNFANLNFFLNLGGAEVLVMGAKKHQLREQWQALGLLKMVLEHSPRGRRQLSQDARLCGYIWEVVEVLGIEASPRSVSGLERGMCALSEMVGKTRRRLACVNWSVLHDIAADFAQKSVIISTAASKVGLACFSPAALIGRWRDAVKGLRWHLSVPDVEEWVLKLAVSSVGVKVEGEEEDSRGRVAHEEMVTRAVMQWECAWRQTLIEEEKSRASFPPSIMRAIELEEETKVERLIDEFINSPNNRGDLGGKSFNLACVRLRSELSDDC
eukprot:Sspe_Gene.84116::Locus_55211_Transcript_1_1_Confidence_1.000_Length_1142::g.84116::m.84116